MKEKKLFELKLEFTLVEAVFFVVIFLFLVGLVGYGIAS